MQMKGLLFGLVGLLLMIGVSVALGGPVKSDSVLNGKAIFAERCVVCHGPQGHGDGTMGRYLQPPAADLTAGATQKQSDETLLTTIATGKRGTAMPAFGGQLSDQDLHDVVAYLKVLSGEPPRPSDQPKEVASRKIVHGTTTQAFSLARNLPSLDDLPPGEKSDAIRYGYELVTNTQQHLKDHVGNKLNCEHCHLNAGRTPHAGPFVGVYAAYPIYRSRNAMMNTVDRRINDCFERSMNGTPLLYDSSEMSAIVTYMAWLSTGIPAGTIIPERGFPRIKPSRPPNPENGRTLFGAKCAMCHGPDGHGTVMAPPLWGPDSFNTGAGMAKLDTAAAFIKHNMPLGQADSLTSDEAYDIAAHITSRPRPDFSKAAGDHPKGTKPGESLF